MKVQCENCKNTYDHKEHLENRCPFCCWLNPTTKTNYDIIKSLSFTELVDLIYKIKHDNLINTYILHNYCCSCNVKDCEQCEHSIRAASERHLIKIYLSTEVKKER